MDFNYVIFQVKDEAKTLLGKLAAAKEADAAGEGDTTRNEGLDMDISGTEDSTPLPTTSGGGDASS